MISIVRFAKWIYSCAVVIYLLQFICNGCVPQVCRKRRQITDGTVSLQLQGCSGYSPSWVRQIASCLSINSADMSLRIKQWYTNQYDVCLMKGCSTVKNGARDRVAIQHCLNCWIEDIKQQQFVVKYNIPTSDIEDCMNKYLYSFLSKELPTLDMTSVHKGSIRLPVSRPADNWFSLTVRLPCKPRIFMFWNSYCVNSFVDGLRDGDIALTQNQENFMKKEDITFFVEFGDDCRFDQNSIRIIWSESVPTPALPQISRVPSNFPPHRNETGQIYLDQDAFRRLVIADGRMPVEFAVAGRKASPPRRRKRQVLQDEISELGISLPCSVRHFGLPGRTRPNIDNNNNRRIVLHTGMFNSGRDKLETTLIDFDIDYGYEKTGCIFDSSDISLVVNPGPGWIDVELPIDPKFKRPEKRAQCITCSDAPSNEECERNGTVTTCHEGEACLTTVRQITEEKVRITKICKQRLACDNMERQNMFEHCRPGQQPSVCRCCCTTAECNKGLLPCI